MKRARGGAKPLAEFTPGLVAEALAARGLGETSLIADWPAIVGETLARHARPIELQWPPRAAKRDPDAPAAPATLVLRVESAFALEAQHSASVIIARVNAHLGWRCVHKIAFRQGPLPPLKEKRRPAPLPSEAARSRGPRRRLADRGRRLARRGDAAWRAGDRQVGPPAWDGGRPNCEGRLRDLISRHPLAGRTIARMNGAGNAILVLDLRGSPLRPTAEDARAIHRAPGLELRSDDGLG